MVLGFWGDAGFALATGVVAAAAWSALLLAGQWLRMRRALDAFVGSYEVRRKLSRGEPLGTVTIRREGRTLSVALDDPDGGPAEAVVRLSERFPKSGRGTYEQRLKAGGRVWGTWDLDLDAERAAILVTTRYSHPARETEIVQGYEWRRGGPG